MTTPINPASAPSTMQLEIQPDDTLSEIAEKRGVPLEELLKLNPQFDATKVDGKLDTQRTGQSGWDPDFIRPGDVVLVPKTAQSGTTGTRGADTTGADTSGANTNGTSPDGGVQPASWKGTTDDVANPTSLNGKKAEAMRYFQSQGWTAAQAAGIVANLQVESRFDPNVDTGDGGLAYGLAQWHPDRQENFKRMSGGKSIQDSTFAEQLQFVQWELTHTEKAAGNALKRANTAEEAGAIVSKLYERPLEREKQADLRAALADRIFDAHTMNA